MGPLSEESGELHAVTRMLEQRVIASMGPLSEESGESPALMVADVIDTVLQWGRSPKRAESEVDKKFGGIVQKLQWGRSPKRAESSRSRLRSRTQSAASMGPLSEESGEGSRKMRVRSSTCEARCERFIQRPVFGSDDRSKPHGRRVVSSIFSRIYGHCERSSNQTHHRTARTRPQQRIREQVHSVPYKDRASQSR